ncbi:MAG: YwbE family protein [Eubacteriaceae bacterium]|nr:YwbE family protein [Eubacteriaceae bacterium]
MDGKKRSNVKIGLIVDIVQKKDQRTGALTRGKVKRILTNSATHPHGIKVMLDDGTVGRIQAIIIANLV